MASTTCRSKLPREDSRRSVVRSVGVRSAMAPPVRLQYEVMNVISQYGISGHGASAVAESAERAIAQGRLAPGSLLPPVRALAAALGLSAATVAAAYRTLRIRGLVS